MPPVQPLDTGSGSIDDLVSVMLNVVTAISNSSKTYLNVAGAQNKSGVSTTTLVSQKAGRAVRISVTVAGSTTGLIYDCGTTSNLLNPIYVIPTAVGAYDVNLPVGIGIVVVPGTSQVLTISFS